jgi:hypothetical protein
MNKEKRYLKIALAIVIISMLNSCSTHSLIGKWESQKQIIQKFNFTRELHQGKWYYHTMEFKKDGNLIIGNFESRIYDTVKYILTGKTIKITAKNGLISTIPILKINASELRTLDALDSVVTVYGRIK